MAAMGVAATEAKAAEPRMSRVTPSTTRVEPLTGTPPDTALRPGALVDGYRLEGVLGRQTGSSIVYVATHVSTQEVRALKAMPAGLTADEEARARFKADVSDLTDLVHPSVVRVHGSAHSGSGLFLVMELVQDPSLASLMRFGELSERRAVELLLSVAEALDYAGGRGVAHRDLKPQKVLVSREGGVRAMVLDFGAGKPRAIPVDQIDGHSETTAYASPEQLRGEVVTRAGNVYSIGAIAFECLTGTRPAEGAGSDSSSPSLAVLRPDLGRRLERVLRRGMDPDPDKRPATAGDLLREVRDALEASAGSPMTSAVQEARHPVPPDSTPTGATNEAALRSAAPARPVHERSASTFRAPRDAPGRDAVERDPHARRTAFAAVLATGGLLAVAAAGTAGWLAGSSVAGEGGANAEYARGLHARVEVLNDRRMTLRTRLAGAVTRSGQSETARSLARAYDSTAVSLRALESPPPFRGRHDAVEDAAVKARDAYRQLGARARRGDRAGYRRAVRRVRSIELTLERELRALSNPARSGRAL